MLLEHEPDQLIADQRLDSSDDAEFSLRQATRIVKDLFVPNPWIYWLDMAGSSLLAHAAFAVVVLLPAWLAEPVWVRIVLQAIALAVCVLSTYRASIFIHELVHLRKGTFYWFRLAWHALCGVPILLPSFLYHIHIDHHRRCFFGTPRDAEYMPLQYRSRRQIFVFVGLALMVPLLAVLRFYILSPIAWIVPLIRRRSIRYRSSLTMELSYERPWPNAAGLRTIYLGEAACFCWLVLMTTALLTFLRPWAVTLLVTYYLVLACTALINSLRSLVTHRWLNEDEEMSFVEQLLDSVNFPRRPLLSELFAPLGQRFHATHHLFPSIPYHNLPAAHRRLMNELPPDSPYRQTVQDSFLGALWDVWQRAGSYARRRADRREPA